MAVGKELRQREDHQAKREDWSGDVDDDSQKNYSLKANLKTRVVIKTKTKGKTTLA